MKVVAIILDLEGTLFSSNALAQAHISHILSLLSKRMGINATEAKERFESAKENLAEELNHTPSFTVLVESLGISRGQFYDEIARVNPQDYLNPDGRLYEMLKTLKAKGLKLGLLTNAAHDYALRILDALGVCIDVFDSIVAGNDVISVKPCIEPFHYILKSLGVSPYQSLMVGDRIHIDLLPAKKLNMKTALICEHSSLQTDKEYVDLIFHNIYELVDSIRF